MSDNSTTTRRLTHKTPDNTLQLRCPADDGTENHLQINLRAPVSRAGLNHLPEVCLCGVRFLYTTSEPPKRPEGPIMRGATGHHTDPDRTHADHRGRGGSGDRGGPEDR